MVNASHSDIDSCLSLAADLCRIPSPSGYTRAVEDFVLERLLETNFEVRRTRKGSILVDIGGSGEPLVLAAHIDTLGAMVRSVKSNGRLRITKIGGYPDAYIVAENCLVHTRDGRQVTGTIQPANPAAHVNSKLKEYKPTEEDLEIVLDARVSSPAEVRTLGVENGDMVSLDPRTRITETGYIKSRHLDDKASAAVLLTLARLVAMTEPHESTSPLRRKVYLLFTTYEEVGHGGATGIPADAEEVISVDMGAVGADLSADEHVVSICAKDSGGPYDYRVTGALIQTAKSGQIPYAVDIYPFYGSDVEASLRAGFDIAHGLLGPGVSASHGYERAHLDGIGATLRLLAAYISR
jgi:putative aminopeptidase FrvX